MTSPAESDCAKRPGTAIDSRVTVLRSTTRRSTSARRPGSFGHSRSRNERSSFSDRSNVESTSVEIRRSRSSSIGSSIGPEFWRTAIQLYQRATQPKLTAQVGPPSSGVRCYSTYGLKPRFYGAHLPRDVQQGRVELDESSFDRRVLRVALDAARVHRQRLSVL